MASPRVLVRDDESSRKHSWLPPAPDYGWRLLGFVGLVLFISGMLDLVMAGYPLMIGNPDWEFGTIGSMLNGLAVPMTGLALLTGAAAARGWQAGLKIWAVIAIVVAVVIVGLTVIWALNLPLAFKTVQQPVIRLGLKKSVAKTLAQAVLYPAAFMWLGLAALRHARAQR